MKDREAYKAWPNSVAVLTWLKLQNEMLFRKTTALNYQKNKQVFRDRPDLLRKRKEETKIQQTRRSNPALIACSLCLLW